MKLHLNATNSGHGNILYTVIHIKFFTATSLRWLVPTGNG